MKTEVLRVQNLFIKTEDRGHLADFCLHIDKGEALAIAGLHDTGKTLLMDCLTGKIVPDQGEIYWHEEPASLRLLRNTNRIYRIRKISGLYEYFTVAENISVIHKRRNYFDRIPWKALRLHVEAKIREFGLDLDPAEYAVNLSLLQRCEAEILRAYLSGTELVLLDEVITKLNDTELYQLGFIMKKFQESGLSFIVTGFRFHQLQFLADRCLFIRNGMSIKTVSDIKHAQVDDLKILAGFSRSSRDRGSYVEPRENEGKKPILSLHNLEGTDGSPVNLQIQPGEIVVILDPFKNLDSDFQNLRKRLLEERESKGEILLDGEPLNIRHLQSVNKLKIADFQNDPKIFEGKSVKENLALAGRKSISFLGFMPPSKVNAVYRNFRNRYRQRADFQFLDSHLTYPEKMAIYLECLSLNKWKLLICRNLMYAMSYDLEPLVKGALRDMVTTNRSVCILASSPERYYDLADVFWIQDADGSVRAFSGEELRSSPELLEI